MIQISVRAVSYKIIVKPHSMKKAADYSAAFLLLYPQKLLKC